MAVAYSRRAGWANVSGKTEALKPLDRAESCFGDVTHQRLCRILLI